MKRILINFLTRCVYMLVIAAVMFGLLQASSPIVTPVQAQANCTENQGQDILFILDLSNSMNEQYVGTTTGLTKIQAAKSALVNTISVINDSNNRNIINKKPGRSRIGLLTFNTGSSHTAPNIVSVFKLVGSTNSDFVDPTGSGNLNQMNSKISPLVATGNTPLADTMIKARNIFNDRSQKQPPVFVLISDGVPNVDLAGHAYETIDINNINVENGLGGFRSESDVRESGARYFWGFEGFQPIFTHLGAPIADLMRTVDQLTSQVAGLDKRGFAIAINAKDAQADSFNKSTLHYVGYRGGGGYSDFHTFDPQNYQELAASIINALKVDCAGDARMSVVPDTGINASGIVGGPFTPDHQAYVITNTGFAPLDWTASATKSWVTVDTMSGHLEVGKTQTVNVSINNDASQLSEGVHNDTVTFTNSNNGDGSTTRPVKLTITSGGGGGTGQLLIDLPPTVLAHPTQVYFGGNTYTINGTAIGSCSGSKCSGPDAYIVLIDSSNFLDPSHKNATTDATGRYYQISIGNFKPAQGSDTSNADAIAKVYGFKVVYSSPYQAADITTLDDYLRGGIHPDNKATAYLGNDLCAKNVATELITSICLQENLTVTAPGVNPASIQLKQRINRAKIVVEGNVAAPGGLLNNFSLTGQAIAIGKNITNVAGGQSIKGYPIENTSKINWNNVSTSLSNIYAKRDKSLPVDLGSGYTTGLNWNLNSSDNRPNNPDSNSFSTPPEGRLWNIVVSGNSFDIGGPAGINFTGSGTLAISSKSKQNVTVTIHNHLTCSSNTRLGIITSGNIKFVTAPDQVSKVDCGAFVSLDSFNRDTGNIYLDANNGAKNGTMNGLFIAKNDVVLPDPNTLTGIYKINRDSYFVTHPTVLFADLLKVIFLSSS